MLKDSQEPGQLLTPLKQVDHKHAGESRSSRC